MNTVCITKPPWNWSIPSSLTMAKSCEERSPRRFHFFRALLGTRTAFTSAQTAEGIRARVVSMPSTDIFDMQNQAYKDSVLPPNVRARVSVEVRSTLAVELRP